MRKLSKQIPVFAFFLLWILVLLSARVGVAHAGWETFSLESIFSIDRGNLEKTEFGGEASVGGEVFAGRHSLLGGKVKMDKFEGESSLSKEWKGNLFSELLRKNAWALNFGSFIEADERDSLDLRYGLGAGVSRGIEKLPFSMKLSPGLDIFYERERNESEPAHNRAVFRFAVSIERTKGDLKPSASSLFAVPADERDDWRSESMFSLRHILKKFDGANLSITFNAGLKIQNKPPANKKKSDFTSDIGLRISFEKKD